MKDGFYAGMSFEEYQAIDALNGSSLVHLRRSPMYYKWAKENPQPPTDAMILGTATHRMILEPDRVGDFAVYGEVEGQNVRRGKVWDEFQAANAGKMILTKEERDFMVGQVVSVRRSPDAWKYLSAKGPTEYTMVWTDKVSGRRFKGRLDKLIPSAHTIVDLKSARSCISFKFGGQAYALNYHIKAAIYSSGYEALTGIRPKFKFVAVEPKPPHECAVYRLTSDVLLQGLEDLDALVKLLDECEKTNTWPPTQPEESDLVLPAYAYTSAEDLADLTYDEGDE